MTRIVLVHNIYKAVRFNMLFNKMVSFENIEQAWKSVKAKGSHGGIDSETIEHYSLDIIANLNSLKCELESGNYIPDPSLLVYIPKSNKKWREISLITIKDKIAQKAFANAILPIIEKNLSPKSYAYRPKKGHQKAIKYLLHTTRNKSYNVIVADIKNFFDSINQEIMLNIFEKHISAEIEIISLLKLWLGVGKVTKGKYKDNKMGVPQGFIISPLLANLYLTEFDNKWIDRVGDYLRYADNFIWIDKDEQRLKTIFEEAKQYLLKERKLEINYLEYQESNTEKGFDFLGINFKQGKLKIAEKKMDKAHNKICRIIDNNRFSLTDKITKLNNATFSWNYYYRIVDDQQQKKQIDYWIISKLKERYQNKVDLYKIRYLSHSFGKMISGKLVIKDCKNVLGNSVQERKDSANNAVRNKLATQRKFYKRKYNIEGEFLLIKSGSTLRLRNDNLLIVYGDQKISISLNNIKIIQIPSQRSTITTDLISRCASSGIPIFLSDNFGTPNAQILPQNYSHLDIVIKQAEYSRGQKGLDLAKAITIAKLKNQMKVVQYFSKYRLKRDQNLANIYNNYITTVRNVENKINELQYSENYAKVLMGYEGTVASLYWNMFGLLINKPDFKREHQRAKDLINSCLNYGYGFLYHRITKSLIRKGLNPCSSFMHSTGNNKPALVFDLIEPFRAIIVDRVVISCQNKKIHLALNNKGYLEEETRKAIARQFLNRMHSRFNYKGGDTSFADQLEKIVDDYKKHITSGLDFKPFIWFY